MTRLAPAPSRAAEAATPDPALVRGAPADAVLLGAAATGIALIAVQVPDLWRDEVATVAAATRSWSALLAMVGRVDAVHAVYYAAMHVWFDLVGYTPFTLRLPSVLAAGGTAAATTVLGRHLGGRAVGFGAGGAAAVLPALVWAGGEGRSSALVALNATLATLALVRAQRLEGPRMRHVLAWVGYAALVALGGALFVDSLLIVPAHLVALLALRARRALAPFTGAAVGVVLADLPLIRLAAAQGAQVSWIPAPDFVGTPRQILVEQWFRSEIVGWLALALLVVGAAVALARTRRRRRDLPGAASERRTVLAVGLPWAVLPTALLLSASAVHAPLYWPRYVLFTAPAVALLLGAAVAVLGRLLPIGLLALAVAATPQIVADRQPRAKADTEIGLAARLVGAARTDSPTARREGIVYGQCDDIPGLTTGLAALAYPADFQGLADLTALRPIRSSTTLFEPRMPPLDSVPRMRDLDRVWILLDLDGAPKTVLPVTGLRTLGFRETARFRAPGSLLLRWDRTR